VSAEQVGGDVGEGAGEVEDPYCTPKAKERVAGVVSFLSATV